VYSIATAIIGVRHSSHHSLIPPFEILPYDEAASKYYGMIRSQLEPQGNVIGPLDMLIAAHALSRDLILVTNNEKEFLRIKSLKVENWAG